MRDIGKNIRDLRQRANLTQEEFAQKLFVTRQTVSNYETGKTRPDVDMIVRIGEILNADANAVIYGLPVEEDRRQTLIRAAIFTMVIAVTGVIIILLNRWVMDYRSQTFIMFPYSLVKLCINPVSYAVLGWSLMDVLSVFVQFKRLNSNVARYLRVVLLCLFIALIVLVIPNLIFQMLAGYRVLTTGSVNMTFPYIAVFSELERIVIILNLKYAAVYTLFGVLLYVLGFPQKTDRNKKNPS